VSLVRRPLDKHDSVLCSMGTTCSRTSSSSLCAGCPWKFGCFFLTMLQMMHTKPLLMFDDMLWCMTRTQESDGLH
jgi:hypothetical protein